MFMYTGWSSQQAIRSLLHLMLEAEVSHLEKKVRVALRCEIYDVIYMSVHVSSICAGPLVRKVSEIFRTFWHIPFFSDLLSSEQP